MKRRPMKHAARTTFSALLFLLFASAISLNAANSQAPDGKFGVSQSHYSNNNNRSDPFLPVRLKGRGPEPRIAVSQSELHLQGIIWHATKPVAVINRQRVELNGSVTLRLNSGDRTAKAVAIERDRVVLRVDDRDIELVLER